MVGGAPVAASDRTPPAPRLADAQAAFAAGALDEALQLARRVWAADVDDGQRLGSGRLLLQILYRSGRLTELVDEGLQVLPLLRQAGGRAELIDTLRMLALCGSEIGRFETALAAGQEAHRLAVELGDRGRQSLVTNTLGCYFERIGDPWHGERLLLEALAVARDAEAEYAELVARNNLCGILVGAFYLLRDAAGPEETAPVLERALQHARKAVELLERVGEPMHRAVVHGNLGEVLVQQGQLDEAEPVLRGAFELAQALGSLAYAARIGCAVGELQLARGSLDEARRHLADALQRAESGQEQITALRARHALWRVERAAGRPQEALAHLEAYQRLERRRALSQLRGQSQLFITRLEAEQVRLEAQRERERAVEAEADARRDPLTGLGNRRELQLAWPALHDAVKTERREMALAMLDIDHFKSVNDRFGHAVGDAVLVAVARLLGANLRGDDLVVRIGGEEFLLVLPDATVERALEVCERLRQRIAAHGWELLCPALQVTVSIGVASAPPLDLSTLMRRADAALYAAKHAGRNRVVGPS